jgi:hypothetical protein
MTDKTRPALTSFSAWVRTEHLALDPIGQLAAAMRGDRNDPDPFDMDELRCYLVSVGASDDMHRVAAEAWSCFQAEQHLQFARAVAEYAEQWQEDVEPITLTLEDLLAELGHEDADSGVVEHARVLLCDLAPWLVMTYATLVRVERGTMTLDYGGAARLAAASRYGEPEGDR